MRIIPDCCADIIFDLIGGCARFVGVSDNSFLSSNNGVFFGIRFYAWAVSRFTDEKIDFLFNGSTQPENIFKGFSRFKIELLHANGNERRVTLAQKYLLDLLDENIDADIMNCLFAMIKLNCNVSVRDLSNHVAMSSRTLERKFLRNIGVSPKTMTELIRYQMLWQDCIKPNFCVPDSVDKFGYYDQAHLYNDFRKYHGEGLFDARSRYTNLSRFYNTTEF